MFFLTIRVLYGYFVDFGGGEVVLTPNLTPSTGYAAGDLFIILIK